MKLFHSPATPFGRKVMAVLHETGQLAQVEVVGVSGTPLATGTLPVDLNPLGKIPALQLDSGQVIYDSRVICRYLDDRAGADLYGKGDALWQVLTLEAMADGMLDASLLMTYEARLRPEPIRFPDWVEAQWAKVARALDALEERWLSHLGGPLCMGQVAVACALGYLDLRHDARGWREGRAGLAAFGARMAARDSMIATVPPG